MKSLRQHQNGRQWQARTKLLANRPSRRNLLRVHATSSQYEALKGKVVKRASDGASLALLDAWQVRRVRLCNSSPQKESISVLAAGAGQYFTPVAQLAASSSSAPVCVCVEQLALGNECGKTNTNPFAFDLSVVNQCSHCLASVWWCLS